MIGKSYLVRKYVSIKKYLESNVSAGEFLKNISQVFAYKGIVYVLITLITVIAARSFAISEFGQVGVINALSYLLAVPMIMGINNSMYKFLPSCGEEEKDELILASMIGNVFFSLLSWCIYFFIYKYVFYYVKLTWHEWIICIVVTFTVNLYSLTESFLRGRKKYGAICRIKLVSTILNLIILLMFLLVFDKKSADYYFLSFIIGQTLFCGLAIASSNISNVKKIRLETLRKVYSYGLASTFSMLGITIIFSSDIFLIHYFCNAETVGLYSAYQGFIKNIFSVLFFEIFSVVFLPAIAQADYKQLKYIIRRYSIHILCLVSAGSAAMISFFIMLFGASYTLNPAYIALSSAGIAVYTVFQLYLSVCTMEGRKSAFKIGMAIMMVLPICLCIQVYAIKSRQMAGGLVSVLLTNLLLILALEVMHYVDGILYKVKHFVSVRR